MNTIKTTATKNKSKAPTKAAKKRFRMPVPKVPVVNQKAIDVAKDVLKQLDATTFIQGSYFWGSFPLKDMNGDAQFADVVDVVRERCQVCLLGACVLAKARVLDKITCKDALHESYSYPDEYFVDASAYEQLKSVFGRVQCSLMESVFEQNDDAGYGFTIPNHKERVKAVMTNLIHNGGVFIMPKVESK